MASQHEIQNERGQIKERYLYNHTAEHLEILLKKVEGGGGFNFTEIPLNGVSKKPKILLKKLGENFAIRTTFNEFSDTPSILPKNGRGSLVKNPFQRGI